MKIKQKKIIIIIIIIIFSNLSKIRNNNKIYGTIGRNGRTILEESRMKSS